MLFLPKRNRAYIPHHAQPRQMRSPSVQSKGPEAAWAPARRRVAKEGSKKNEKQKASARYYFLRVEWWFFCWWLERKLRRNFGKRPIKVWIRRISFALPTTWNNPQEIFITTLHLTSLSDLTWKRKQKKNSNQKYLPEDSQKGKRHLHHSQIAVE